jgi:glycerol-3-phosphate dehydrogenase
MQRNLAEMAHTPFDIVIIGGGITGASIAWDASLRGLRVALLDKQDFASATTSASSKLIHGGLRYLRNFEFGLVRESLRERRIWQTIAPHMVMPLPFILPGASRMQHLTLRAGLVLYDLLSFDRNRGMRADKYLPGHHALSPAQAISAEPLLAGAAQAGALRYYDCQMHTPERLALEFLAGAVANGAQIANYAQVMRLNGAADRVSGVTVRDLTSGQEYDVTAGLIINAAGPWADYIVADAGNPATVNLQRSKGIHLITRALSRHAIAVIGDDAHFFVLPWRGHSILATTDTPYTDDPDKLTVTESDVAELLARVNRGLPQAQLTRKDVLHSYAGLRPLVADATEPNSNTYGASRGSEIFDHAKQEGRAGLISALGGKWTTSRYLAQQVVDLAFHKLGRDPIACRTASTPLIGAMENFPAFADAARKQNPDLDAALVEHLARTYGARMDHITNLIAADPAMAIPLAAHLPEVGAQIIHAARHELALTLEDAVFRRTGLCTLGHPGLSALEKAATIMAQELGWDTAERTRQIAAVEQRFQISNW